MKKWIELMQKQHAYYQAIWEITQEESERLKKGLSIQNLLNKKRIFICCIDEIEEQMAPFRKKMDLCSNEEKNEIETLCKTVKKLLEKMLAKDQENQKILQEQLLSLKEKTKTANLHPAQGGKNG